MSNVLNLRRIPQAFYVWACFQCEFAESTWTLDPVEAKLIIEDQCDSDDINSMVLDYFRNFK